MTTQACLNGFEWTEKIIKLIYNDNSQTDTGVDIPANCLIDPFTIAVYVQTADSGETLNVGMGNGTESGYDADGLLVGVSIASTGWVVPAFTVTAGSQQNYVSARTLGAFFYQGDDGSDLEDDGAAPIIMPKLTDGTCTSIDYTCSAGSDTFVGILYIRWFQLPDLTNFLT
jgi:hypothetical protein